MLIKQLQAKKRNSFKSVKININNISKYFK